MELEGKVVIVTGASKGIGLACAESFLRAGAKVALVSRSRANLDTALARLPHSTHKPLAIVADLSRAEGRWREAGYTTLVLPSSSPAYTRPFAEKLAAWRAIAAFL